MPKKIKTIYTCSKCDAQFPKWQGRCTECGAWGTLSAAQVAAKPRQRSTGTVPAAKLETLADVSSGQERRMTTSVGEFDRVLGGGVIPGSIILVGGDPGIGKSTLILQIGGRLAESGKSVLYISGEESSGQVKERFGRLGLTTDKLKFLGETNIDVIDATIREYWPDLVILDSIQTIYAEEVDGDPGSVSQVRTATGRVAELSHESHIPVIVIGHVTKQGNVAGPRTLEHLVDVVLYLEGDQHHVFRILRGVKNRFGSTSEIGVFDMQPDGLHEVKNPSQVFMSGNTADNPGSVITAVVEGSRAFLVEVQALVSRTNFGYPQRRASGFDLNRLQMLVAVLIKKAGLYLGSQDVHVNVAGGFRVSEPAVDLAVCLAIVSALRNKPVSPGTVVFGEVGLGGEVRPVGQTDQRLKEARKMGLHHIIAPKQKTKPTNGDSVLTVDSVQQAIREVL